jgi:S1-C subfamily serine protease
VSPLLFASLAFGANGLSQQVVSLTITWQTWETAQPWSKTSPSSRKTQATVVSTAKGPALLTTAQMVDNATLLRATKNGDPNESLAHILYVDREANLALVTVDDASFYDDLSTVRFAKKPSAEGDVVIARWRENQFESTQGRIARASVIDSATGVLDQISLRVTSDLSGGGWSEPVFVNNALVGVTTAAAGSELTVLPSDFVASWLGEVAKTGSVRPWPGSLGLGVQEIRSPYLADWLGLTETRGVMVLKVAQGSSACGTLKRGDVILAADGQPLDGDGNLRHPLYGLLHFEHLLSLRHVGDTLPLSILRDGKPMEISLTMRAYNGGHWLIPVDQIGAPGYLMAGGLVFREFDESYPSRSAELRIVSQLQRTAQTTNRRRIVVLQSVLADTYNLGYHGFGDLPIRMVNGQEIDSLVDVVEALKAPVDGYHVFTLIPNLRIAEIVLDAATFDDATLRIAESYGIPSTYRAPAPPPELGGACE